ncbi:MAG: alpha/beta family hydrolase [Ilumatobacteraceae bacterium]|nr:alpha/beta family hydrolase [Ilumatobacteraceae bacterium]
MTFDATTTTVEVDGVGLDTLVLPAGDAHVGPPLVLLHDGLGSVGLWRGFPAALHTALGEPKVVVYSRAGYGHSGPAPLPRPVTYMHHEADVVLAEMLRKLGIERPVLVGHSDGASIALLHAGAGHDVAGLVLLAPHVVVEDMTIASIDAARAAYVTTDLRARLGRHHDDVDRTFRGWNDVWLSPAFRSWNIEDRLAAIECPVLLVQGDEDPYGSLEQLDRIESGACGPVTRLVVSGVGHAPHLEAAEVTVAATAAFVGALSPGPC